MSKTTEALERVLGREGLSKLAGELGGQVIRVPSSATVSRPERIAAVQRAIDAGATKRQAAQAVGCSAATVTRISKL